MSSSQNFVTSILPVPPDVQADIWVVRDTGLANMLDANLVIEILDALDMDESAVWIEDNMPSYLGGILTGFDGHGRGNAG